MSLENALQHGLGTETKVNILIYFCFRDICISSKLISYSEVKIELTDDSSLLHKSGNGIFELFLHSFPGHGTLPRAGTLPRREIDMGTVEKVQRRRRSFVDLEDVNGTESSHPASSLGTVISRRAGERLAELYTSNSEDPYKFEESSRFFLYLEDVKISSSTLFSATASSSMYEPLAVHGAGHEREKIRKRRPRKGRFRKAYVPSTISSVTESSMTSLSLPRILEVCLSMKNVQYLGISVVSFQGSIFVSEIIPGERALYDQRRNGISRACFEDAERRRENEQNGDVTSKII
uniref:POP4 domain-containing protein n=1 Tax=Heterorhabditis bacteriophora TaxID=37862 RepID=A0A1I7X0R8_HETBA